ncbi:MAG: hypothetical protein AB8C84_05060 [Oligoflexales bacterium]
MMRWKSSLLVSIAATGLLCLEAHAAPRDTAKRMFSRITGVAAPSTAIIDQMEAHIEANKPEEAAKIAVDHTAFLSVRLVNLFRPFTNEEASVDGPLNDTIVTLIGCVNDSTCDFFKILSDDIIYTGSDIQTPYATTNNTHYEEMTQQLDPLGGGTGFNLKTDLIKGKQSTVTGMPAGGVSGVLSTRGFAQTFFFDGTNRAVIKFAYRYFLEKELESFHDNTVEDSSIRADVDRAPGGDSNLFISKCSGCHSGMDAMGDFAAYYDFKPGQSETPEDGFLEYTPGVVQPKMNRNVSVFPDARRVVDDKWINKWVTGKNEIIGWRGNIVNGQIAGQGLSAWGEMLARTNAFSDAFAFYAVKHVCNVTPQTAANPKAKKQIELAIHQMGQDFRDKHKNFKQLFIDAAVKCIK